MKYNRDFLSLAGRKPEEIENEDIKKTSSLLDEWKKIAVSTHWLGYPFATHFLESGIDLMYIQELPERKNTKTTEIHTHVSTKDLRAIKSPGDDLLVEDEAWIEELKNKGRPEGGICEQFGYFTDMSVYPNSSDINDLSEMANTNEVKNGIS